MKHNYLPIYFGIAVVIGMAIGTFFNYQPKGAALYNKEQKIQNLIQLIEHDYVDVVDTDKLLDNVAEGIVAKLDPHSVYFSRDEYLANKENMQGNFEGIGVQFLMYKDSLVVTKVLPNGPSEKIGIVAGDRILKADKDTLYGKKLQSSHIIKTLKGPAGTSVNLEVYRKSAQKKLSFLVHRGKVAIKSINVAYMLNTTLGYIKIERFSLTTYVEFLESLKLLKSKGAKNLVLDLRQNGGGFIHVANQIIDEFLEEGKLIVFTKNNKERIEKSFATSGGNFEKGEVYVLIDEGSASASEIVAGALQDNDKGTIVGRRSFGKGLVQQEFNLGDGSAVRLTIARYYTPTGRSIQKPYELNNNEAYNKDYSERLLNGELLSKDSIKTTDSLKFRTSKGKVVYGGGGIIPDVFVAIDTTHYLQNRYFKSLNEFVFDYIDTNRQMYLNMNFETFDTTFNSGKILDLYLNYIELKDTLTADKEKVLQGYLKALIANQLYDDNAYYKIQESSDTMLQKVLELEKK